MVEFSFNLTFKFFVIRHLYFPGMQVIWTAILILFCVLFSGAAGYNVGGGQAGMYMNLNGGDNYQSSDNSVGDNVQNQVCAWDSTFLCAGVANSGFKSLTWFMHVMNGFQGWICIIKFCGGGGDGNFEREKTKTPNRHCFSDLKPKLLQLACSLYIYYALPGNFNRCFV